MEEAFNKFRLLTPSSIKEANKRYKESVIQKKIEKKRIKKQKKLEKKHKNDENTDLNVIVKKPVVKELKPDRHLEAGKKLPHCLGDYFPTKRYGGKMMEEIDPYYKDKQTFLVIDSSKQIYRFSTTNSFFMLSPFNPIRTLSIKILCHPSFSNIVLLTIIVNCITMAMKKEEYDNYFLGIYTVEFLIKAISRGLIGYSFTYLRDYWNWLDFLVVGVAYIQLGKPHLAKYAGIRTLRVLRALKAVTTIPGMKIVVNALIRAIIKLRDAFVLTIFVLSIFGLVGLQLYRGTLLQKCVKAHGNYNLSENWHPDNLLCMQTEPSSDGLSNNGSTCPEGYVCRRTSTGNPDFNYTTFDSFPMAFLCSFRLMTQDYWEDLYRKIIRTSGRIHVIFFMAVIFFGSFYLINVILAIVAMSYDDVRRADMAEVKEEEADKKEEEVKREMLIEQLEEELEAGSEDLEYTISEYEEEQRYVTIKSCGDLSQSIGSLEKLINLQRRKSLQIYSNREPISWEYLNKFPEIAYESNKVTEKNYYNENLNKKNDAAGVEIRKKSKENQLNIVIDKLSNKSQTSSKELPITTDPEIERRMTMYEIYEEENKKSRKEKFLEWFLNTFFDWKAIPFYSTIQKCVAFIVLDPFMEMFITLCIVLNTIFMAIDTPDRSGGAQYILKTSNYVFVGVFTFEAVMKLLALSPIVYFTEKWNLFDWIVVIFSLVELGLDSNTLSIIRTFRLLRIFKLAKSWKTMNLLFTIIGTTLGAIGNLCIVLGIIIFIFAVVGMQLFGGSYSAYQNSTHTALQRWNFCDFTHSFMIVFRVLCGEYMETMWACMQRVGPSLCVPFFVSTMILGNLVILNLFIALLLSSFGSETLQKSETDESEINKLQEGFDRIYRMVVWVKIQILGVGKFFKKGLMHIVYRYTKVKYPEPWNVVLQKNGTDLFPKSQEMLEDNVGLFKNLPISAQMLDNSTMTFLDKDPEINEGEIVFWRLPFECMPYSWDQAFSRVCGGCWYKTYVYRAWWYIRCKAFYVVDHKFFENFILAMIIISSLTLTLEDKSYLTSTLKVLDHIFTIIFTIEMLLKWMSLGLTKYFNDPWCWLDFVIVTIALISFGFSFGQNRQDYNSLKALRTLRALRPLRAVSRWEGMRVVVNALIQAIPSILNVLLVILVFWMIFAIMGTQFFAKKFYKCVFVENKTKVNASIVWNKTMCSNDRFNGNVRVAWENSLVNFDSFFDAYLALFQVATFKGWVEIMADAVDSAGVDEQPIYENKTYFYGYFVLFIIVGAFFTLNLFIGVIIEFFNVQKKRMGGDLEIFMTEDQKKYYNALRKMNSSTPQKPIPKPSYQIGFIFYNICSNQKFDIVIMCFIMLNTVIMCTEHYGQPPHFTEVLAMINKVFVLIFACECVMKLIAYRCYYFKNGWNLFDFVIAVSSIVFWMLSGIINSKAMQPTLMRVVRLFRISRVLRLIKSARGIRTLLFSLVVSLPSLFNIFLLLMLMMFIYGIVGVSMFKDCKNADGIDDIFNFRTFLNAVIILFQISTTAGWNSIYSGLMKCKNRSQAQVAIYLVTYIIISALVIVNMYIAVILENFSQATKDVEVGLTQDDYDLFYEIWEIYDPDATGYIELKYLYEFVDKIGLPLGIPRPNKISLAILEIPIYEGNFISSHDLMDILTKRFLSGGSTASDINVGVSNSKSMVEMQLGKTVSSEQQSNGNQTSEKKEKINDTLKLQRENWAATKITHLIRAAVGNMKLNKKKDLTT